MPVDFTAIDFETANSHAASACAVGLARVRDGTVVERAQWLIRPPETHGAFAAWNIRIHGITPAMVADAGGWEDQLPQLRAFLGDDIAVAHNAGFDMGVIRGACAATVTPTPRLRYLCSVQLARKTYELPSYRLPLAAEAAGHGAFAHHDALADAEACATIVLDSARRHGATSVAELARITSVRVQRLTAIPLTL